MPTPQSPTLPHPSPRSQSLASSSPTSRPRSRTAPSQSFPHPPRRHRRRLLPLPVLHGERVGVRGSHAPQHLPLQLTLTVSPLKSGEREQPPLLSANRPPATMLISLGRERASPSSSNGRRC